MQVGILTVGDELLTGATVNTNAAWLAEQISDRGAAVRRITTLPDERELLAAFVRDWAGTFDAIVVTGGLGGTPDDVTMAAVAAGLDWELTVHDGQLDRLRERARQFRQEHPDLATAYDFDLDFEEAASLPAGADPLSTEVGWAPGCVVENVYVLPGVPEEMRAMFGEIASAFQGQLVSRSIHTPAPEGALGDVLTGFRAAFAADDVRVGSYPGRGETPGRLTVTGEDEEAVTAATAWLRDRIETVDPD